MTVTTPSEYSIDFDGIEIEKIKDAIIVLNDIIAQLKAHKCYTLEGGCYESPIEFSFKELAEVRSFLNRFIEDIPYKMY